MKNETKKNNNWLWFVLLLGVVGLDTYKLVADCDVPDVKSKDIAAKRIEVDYKYSSYDMLREKSINDSLRNYDAALDSAFISWQSAEQELNAMVKDSVIADSIRKTPATQRAAQNWRQIQIDFHTSRLNKLSR